MNTTPHRKQDLVPMLRECPERLRVMTIYRAEMDSHHIELSVHVGDELQEYHCPKILCTNVSDYSIRPRDPNTYEGGPPLEWHEHHRLLDSPGLQMIPGGDGEEFSPPRKLSVLVLGHSYVIAETFEIRE
jgi:hypothetical protein